MIPSDILDFPGPLSRDRILYNLKISLIYRKQIDPAGHMKILGKRNYVEFKNKFGSREWCGEMVERHLACSWGFDLIKTNLMDADLMEPEGKKKALEHSYTQLLLAYEYMIGRKFDDETYRMISKSCGNHKQGGKGGKETCQYVKDEEVYNMTTCYLILKAGADFFKIRKGQKMVEDTSPLEKLTILLDCDVKTIRNKFKKQREADEKYEQMALEQQGKKPKDRKAEESGLPGEFIIDFDQDLKPSHLNFIRHLRHFFTTTCKNAGIPEFTFPIKEITRTPQGVLTYLLENFYPEKNLPA